MAQLGPRRWTRERYQGRVEFLFVYTKEAHPDGAVPVYTGGWTPVLPQTTTWQERAERAARFRTEQEVAKLILVDEEGEKNVKRLYGDSDYLAVVVDPSGRVGLVTKNFTQVDRYLRHNLGMSAGESE